MRNIGKRLFIIISVSLLVLSITSVSYAYLKASKEGKDNNVTLANFGVVLQKDMDEMDASAFQMPLSDEEGVKNKVSTFEIFNEGNVAANYKISLVDKDVISTLKNENIRYQLKRKVGSGSFETLPINNLAVDGLLITGTIEPSETISFELVCWVDYNVTTGGGVFKKYLKVEGENLTNLDKSGANYPELLDNMIPVYYDTTANVWKKADETNRDSSYQWFDYDKQMWANAVTVKETGTAKSRADYLKAAVGTEIAMDDITTMWVWIPRYKYTIFNGNNETVTEQMINVEFEHGIDTTGTVKCHDNILTADDSSSSEICTDETNVNIVNGKSTYTHPAFTFGEEELVGFWYGKFEMSTDDSTCLESENCNKTGLNIYVKPNEISLKAISVSNKFANIRSMELYNNIHGFKQGETATSYLDANGNLSGEILNDNNNFDIHMQKNMEWGAVTYLSQSKYGKMGNSLYQGEYKEIYFNGYREGSERYIFKTGYSAKTPKNVIGTDGVQYNDLTQTEGQGYAGAGASTTGTIYGVYDMNGSQSERVMGNVVDSNGNLAFAYAGTWNNNNVPKDKYYDKYSYSANPNTQNGITRGKLGDATKEELKEFNTSNGGWYGAYNSLGSQWLVRGVDDHINSFSQSNASAADGTNSGTSRPVLAVSREFPWLNS